MLTIEEAVKVLSYKFLMQEGIAGVSCRRGSEGRLVVYVEDAEAARKVPSTLMGFDVEVVVTGRIYALGAVGKVGRTLAGLVGSKTGKWKVVPGGVSCGHLLVTAGTLSSRVYDLRTGRRLFLSNNHVIAASNAGKPGDPILQPGPADGGSYPGDVIGYLERFVPIRPPPDENLVDAAVARPIRDDVLSDEVLDVGVVTSVGEARVGMRVVKSGRTTCYKEGEVTDVNATIKVYGYPWGYSIFSDQVLTTPIGEPGDSGSIVVDVGTRSAVGLLFAGSWQVTALNKMTNVVRSLGITFSPPRPPADAARQRPARPLQGID